MGYRYVFGPVHSRRLGYSLGIDPVPRKLCSMDCVYCEVGRTDRWTMERRDWIPADEILAEVRDALSRAGRVDTVTFSGSGEPILHSRIGYMIDAVCEMSQTPVCLLTNGSHLHDPSVRAQVLGADIIAPSLDAVSEPVFEAIARPHPRLKVGDIVEGLVALRAEYTGRIWLEVLFVSGYNDTDEEVARLAEVVERIRPDRVHVSTVVRPPAYENVFPVSYDRLASIAGRLGPMAEVVSLPQAEAHAASSGEVADRIAAVARRRPVTRADLRDALGGSEEEIEKIVRSMLQTGRITERSHGEEVFLEVPFDVDATRGPRTRANAS